MEVHLVLGQGARLVREEYIDLAQLLVEIGGIHHALLVRLLLIQIHVPLHEHAANDALQLDGYVQRDGYQIVKEYQEGEVILQEILDAVPICWRSQIG